MRTLAFLAVLVGAALVLGGCVNEPTDYPQSGGWFEDDEDR